MKLLTDYAQWYDGIFDDTGVTFHRTARTRGGLAKREQFQLFERLGWPVPPHGLIAELANRTGLARDWQFPAATWQQELDVVVYLDEFQHRGEGKVKLPLVDALTKYPGHYGSLFIPLANSAVSFRHVRFGRLGFWLRQQGGEDWRSNRADNETVHACTQHPEANPISRVLWAVDFLPAPTGLLAVDFNTAPQLVTLHETGTLTAEQVRAELEFTAATNPDWLRQF